MKRQREYSVAITVLAVFVTLMYVSAAAGAVTLEVLNPRGEVEAIPALSPSPRVTDLSDKKIGIYWIGKQGGNNFFDVIEEMLKEKYPKAKITRYTGDFDLGQPKADRIAKEFDTIIYGVGD